MFDGFRFSPIQIILELVVAGLVVGVLAYFLQNSIPVLKTKSMEFKIILAVIIAFIAIYFTVVYPTIQ